MGNILKNELDCTCKEFLASVYGERSRPCTSAMEALFSSILMRSSTIVKELSVPLRACNSRLEAKRAQEMVSRWLMNYDFDGKLNAYLLGRAAQAADERTTFAIDFSDISKEFGGADAFAARGIAGAVRRTDAAEHNREAEKVASREPGANAFSIGIGVACAAKAGGRRFRSLRNDGENEGCDPILTRRFFAKRAHARAKGLDGAKKEDRKIDVATFAFPRGFGAYPRQNQ